MTMNRTGESRFRNLADIELIDLLHTMGDGLPREVVDEILARGPRMIPYLYVIVAEKSSWTRYLPEWWAAVHATYILGAFGTQETLPALLSALRWSDAFDCEWVTEDLPSMFGRLGEPAYGPLLTIVRELPAGYGARAIALSSMAAVALKEKTLKTPFLDLAARILADAWDHLAVGLSGAIAMLDPEAIILGGGIGSRPEPAAELGRRLAAAMPFFPVRVLTSRLGAEAQVLGALAGARSLSAAGAAS